MGAEATGLHPVGCLEVPLPSGSGLSLRGADRSEDGEERSDEGEAEGAVVVLHGRILLRSPEGVCGCPGRGGRIARRTFLSFCSEAREIRAQCLRLSVEPKDFETNILGAELHLKQAIASLT